MVIAEGYVLLNGEVETRKRKKIVSGDVIEFAEETIRVQFNREKEKLEVDNDQ